VDRARNLLADILVGIVLLIIAVWVLRKLLGAVLWLANTIAFVAAIVVILIIANRIRAK